MDMDQIHHFLHTHPLILTEEKVNDEVHCKGCGKGLSGSIYGCRDCEFYLHKSCAELQLPPEVQNYFHPCSLVLGIVSTASHTTCNACFHDVSGFSYNCGRCDLYMHVKCALQPLIESEGEELIHHFTHWHPLALVDQNKYLESKCRICDKLCSVSSNSSSVYGCEECNFFLHKSCMINIPRQINHLFHPSCPLILLTTRSYWCDGCREHGSGLVFRCGKCKFHLDVKCTLLPTVESKDADKIQHFSHYHPLALRENMKFGNDVILCGEQRSIKGRAISRDEENSALETTIAKPSNEIAELNVEEKPLEVEFEKLQARLQQIKRRLKLLPSLTISQSTIKGGVISIDEDYSALEATIAQRKNEIAELRAKEKPLEVEVQKLQKKLTTTKQRLKELETDNALDIFWLNHNKRENNYSAEA
ncbi:hypothetical protein PTKIN_Ptkin04bG0213900 [Pterospermum kingtungense]